MVIESGPDSGAFYDADLALEYVKEQEYLCMAELEQIELVVASNAPSQGGVVDDAVLMRSRRMLTRVNAKLQDILEEKLLIMDTDTSDGCTLAPGSPSFTVQPAGGDDVHGHYL